MSNFRRCFSANLLNESNPLPTVHHFTFSMGSSMHSVKTCLKWTKVQRSKQRPFREFAFEAIILTFLCQTVSDKYSENDYRILFSHCSKMLANKGITKLCLRILTPP